MSTFLFTASVFFFSLNAFSVRATFAAYFFACALLILRTPTLLEKGANARGMLTYWLGCITISFIFSAFGDFYLNFFIKFVLIQTYIVLLYWMFSSGVLSLKSIESACTALIYIHGAFFLFQLLYYLATGVFVDFDSYIRESDADALYATKALSDSLISIRALGLYSEPSFYAMTVIPCGVLLLLVKRRITLAAVIAFGTALISFSVASMVVCAVLGFVHVMFERGNLRLKLFVILAVLLCAPAMYNVYDQRVNQSVDYDAVGSRTLILTELQERDLTAGAFGSGLFWDDRNNVGKTHMRGYQARDSSFYVYVLFSVGVVGSSMFFGTIGVMFRNRNKWRYLAYLLPIMLFKYHVLYGMLWMTLLLFAVLAEQNTAPSLPNRRLSTQRPGTRAIAANYRI
ncbi:hypothetical protein [Paraburkholderia guartelaensis]|uniref:O-antigen ligase domain-containing protein n=1 Tax=Paraburkholderia guartelaensis TaxID=2546446 RepID=A0ABU9SKZ9_9BURK